MERVSDSYSTVRNLTDDLISLLARVNYGGYFPFFKKTYSGVMYLRKKCSDHTCTTFWLFTYSFMYFSQTEPVCVTGILIKKERSPAMALRIISILLTASSSFCLYLCYLHMDAYRMYSFVFGFFLLSISVRLVYIVVYNYRSFSLQCGIPLCDCIPTYLSHQLLVGIWSVSSFDSIYEYCC